jgi:hypothetical protein
MTTSVVTTRLPMEAACCKALRVTIAGSMMPATTRSSYWPVRGVKAYGAALVADVVHHDGAFRPGVRGDLAHRLLQSSVHDLRARALVVFQSVDQVRHRSLGV